MWRRLRGPPFVRHCSRWFSRGVPDASSFILPLLPKSFSFDSFSQDSRALLETSSDLFFTLFERLQSIRGRLGGKGTSLRHHHWSIQSTRACPYCSTTLVQHNLESKVNPYPTCSPTLLIPGGLNQLKEKVMTFAGDCTDEDSGIDAFSVRAGLYQGVQVLGSRSFGRQPFDIQR